VGIGVLHLLTRTFGKAEATASKVHCCQREIARSSDTSDDALTLVSGFSGI
jgi:hypothetical protein